MIRLGVIATLKGLVLLFNPKNIVERVQNGYLQEGSNQTYLFFGVIMLIVGTAVSSWA